MRIAIVLAAAAVASLPFVHPALADDGTGVHVGVGAGPNGVGVGAGAGINGTGVSTGAGIDGNGVHAGAAAGSGAYGNGNGYYLDGRYYSGEYRPREMTSASYTYSTGYDGSGHRRYGYGEGHSDSGGRGWSPRNSGYTGGGATGETTYSSYGYGYGYGSGSSCGCDPCSRGGLFGHGGFLGTGLFR
jgi:hypothetical protein